MTGVPLDLDEFKQAWQGLDRRLARQEAMAFQSARDTRLRTLRRRLWPLYGGQLVQIVFGVAMMLGGLFGWAAHLDLPHLVVAGVLLHGYGVALIVAACRTLVLTTQVDYAAPVVSIQEQLARLRGWHVRVNLVLGQAWWFLWMPCLMVAAAAVGVDIWRHAPAMFFVLGAAIGGLGLLLTVGAYRLAGRPGWEWLKSLQDEAVAGASVRRAQAVLDEIRRFEQDAEPQRDDGRKR